jgi:hypothetical protein
MDGVNTYLNNGNGREPTINARLLMQVLNATLTRSRLAQYFSEGDVRRNINHECGYPETESITPEMLRELYDRDAVAARVVELFPDESWQVTPWVYEDEDPSEMTPFEQALDDVVKGLRGTSWFEGDEGNPLWEHLLRADCLCGVGSYGCILLGLDDGKELWEPADGIDDRGQKTGDATGRKLLFLREFDETLATIDSFEQDPTNPRYGQPKQYSLTFDDPKLNRGTSTQANTTKSVHWSRVIHVADGLKTSDLFGAPRLVPVFNRVQDLRKLYGGSAEMYWQGAFPGMAFVTHPQLGSDVALPTNLADTMEEYRNGLQRYLGVAGTEPKMLSPTVVDPTSQIKAHLEAICIRLGVPMRVFLGSERGELASSQDSKAWTDRLRRRQVRWITPRLICPVIDRLVCVGVLPQPERYLVEWPDIAAKTDQEKMQNALQKTQAIGAYIQGQLESIMTPMSYMTKVLDYNEEEAAAILEEAEVNVAEKQALDLPPIGQEFGGGMQQNPFGGKGMPGGEKTMVDEDGQPLPPDEQIDAQAELDKQELEEVPPQFQQNSFCPTGEGGGVDPTCSPGDGLGLHEVKMSATHARKVKGIAVDLAQKVGVRAYASDSSKPIILADDTPENRAWFKQFKNWAVGGGSLALTFGKADLKTLDEMNKKLATNAEEEPLPGVPEALVNALPDFLKQKEETDEEPEDELLDTEGEVDPKTGEPLESEVDPLTGELVEPEIDPVTGLPVPEKSGYDALLEEAKGALPVRGGLLPSDHVPGLRERLLREGEEGAGTASFDEEGAGTGLVDEGVLSEEDLLDEGETGTATDEEPQPEQPPVEEKPEEVKNIFCPTGEGGGIDPTCSPSLVEQREMPHDIPDLEKADKDTVLKYIREMQQTGPRDNKRWTYRNIRRLMDRAPKVLSKDDAAELMKTEFNSTTNWRSRADALKEMRVRMRTRLESFQRTQF